MSDYTPTTEDVEAFFALGLVEWCCAARGLGLVEYAVGNGHALDVGHDGFRRWLAAHDRQVKAEAWDEGAKWGALQVAGLPNTDPEYVQIKAGSNPYRQEQTDEH